MFATAATVAFKISSLSDLHNKCTPWTQHTKLMPVGQVCAESGVLTKLPVGLECALEKGRHLQCIKHQSSSALALRLYKSY